MSSVSQICNLGLSHLGNRARVSSVFPPDGSAEADLCGAFYPMARDEMLEMADWDFARKRVALALVTNPSTVWGYAYALPADCMTPRRILSGLATAAEEDSVQYNIEGSVVLTDQISAVLIYTQPIVDAGQFSPSFATALSYLMASYLAGPIIKGADGAKAAIDFRKVATAMVAGASAINANKSNVNVDFIPSNLAARHGLSTAPSRASGITIFPSGYVIN